MDTKRIQDGIFTLGSLVFVLSLLPAAISPATAVPLSTSLPTAIVLTVFMANYVWMRFWYSATVTAFTASLWYVIALFRG